MNAHELKRIRTELGLSAPEFAKLLGVPRRTYYAREAGNCPIRLESANLVRYVAKEYRHRGMVS